ncbi:hypothetical protein [Parvibaculum sp.]|uniref:hypothetical protein n=1 Tax=Parvibaculum sp. TaxID=2024848 RepID=UPI002730BFB0|nr:hypothetical protein [Parvibaculum sp.]MDP1626613.1 hypothetical protein [Parvibaculum sp.]MDP3327820.1 hypothetical protein [Parvibaculum sp.]
MIAWEAIPYVGTGLSLVAFIVAAFLFAYKARLENSARNIESAPAADRLEAIAAMAEFFRVDLRNLRPEEQKEIVLAQIKHRGRRDLMSGIVAIIVAALLAAVTIIAIESSSVNGGGSGQDQNAEEISIARKNMAQVRSPLVQMGSSQGYRAGNKRQTLTFLQGIDTSSDVDLRARHL